MTIRSPNRSRRWNSISASSGSGLPRQRAQQATASIPAPSPSRRPTTPLSKAPFARSPDDFRPDERLGALAPCPKPRSGGIVAVVPPVMRLNRLSLPSVREILAHIGEPTRPPTIAPARPSAAQSCSAWVPAQTIHGLVVRCSITAHPPAWDDTPVEVDPGYDLLAQPDPEMEFDQRIRW